MLATFDSKPYWDFLAKNRSKIDEKYQILSEKNTHFFCASTPKIKIFMVPTFFLS